MKDSGVEWIGKIPNSWAFDKVKYHFSNTKRIVGTKVNEYQRLALTLKGVIKRSKDDNEGLQPSEFRGYQILKNGELVFKLIDLQNTATSRVGLSSYTGIVSPAYIVLNGKDSILPSFAEKYFLSMWHRNIFNHLGDSGVRSNLNAQELLNVSIAYPNITEQHKIADFLDHKCSEIDALTVDIQTQIEILKEYKKSLIYRYISTGFSKDSKLKETDSKIWSKIPSSWKLVDIKYLFNIVKRIAGKEGFDVLSVTQSGLKIKDITSGEGQLANDYSGYQFVYPGDFVMNHMDLLTGWVDLSKMFGVTSPDYRVFKLKDQQSHIDSYYKYVMQCCYLNRIFYSLGQGVANLGRWRLQTSSFNNFKIPVPPVHEQKKIADFLDQKCSEIDQTISEKQQQLETLAEYKKSLIYEYVTGKKEVA